MGQKVNPKLFRLGIVDNWSSRWFAKDKTYRDYLLQDIKMRKILMSKLKSAGISQVDIERSINKLDITIFVSRPGLVIGRGGQGLEELKTFLKGYLKTISKDNNKLKFEIKVEPVKNINLNAYLTAQSIVNQLIKRVPHKVAVNQAMNRSLSAGAKGIRILLSGRIGGAEISRRERFQSGSVPLSTMRERIDFARVPALTKSGYVGIKVWICYKENSK